MGLGSDDYTLEQPENEVKIDDLGSDDVEHEAGGSKTPVESDLPSPPSPSDKWWSDKAHNCHLRLALGEDGCHLVEEAVTRRGTKTAWI